MKEHKHAEMLRAIADGKDVYYRFRDFTEWHKINYCNLSIALENLSEWRIKPTKTPVDLSVLIESGIDCEFCSSVNFYPDYTAIGYLRMDSESKYFKTTETLSGFKYCRPRMHHWHSWQGGDCPLPEGFVVDVIIRMGETLYNEFTTNKQYWRHDITADYNQIIAFRVVGLADGYCYPWQVEE